MRGRAVTRGKIRDSFAISSDFNGLRGENLFLQRHSCGQSAGVAHGQRAPAYQNLVGSRLPSPYHFRARIQSFQALRRHFRATPFCRAASTSRCTCPAAAASATPRYAILCWQGGRARRLPRPRSTLTTGSCLRRTGTLDETATARLRRRNRQETSEAACLRLVWISTCIYAPSLHTPWIFPFRAIPMVCSKENFPSPRFPPHDAAWDAGPARPTTERAAVGFDRKPISAYRSLRFPDRWRRLRTIA